MGRRTTNVAREQYDLLYKAFAVVAVVVSSCSVLLTIFFWGALYEAGDDVRSLAACGLPCVRQAETTSRLRRLRGRRTARLCLRQRCHW